MSGPLPVDRHSAAVLTDACTPEKSRKTVWKERLINVAKIVAKVAIFTFITIISVLFYLANPSLFAMGFIIGLVIDAKVRETVAKVHKIIIAQPWVLLVVGVGSFLALPVTLAAGSFICGAYASSKIAGMVPEDYDPRTRIPNFIRGRLPEGTI